MRTSFKTLLGPVQPSLQACHRLEQLGQKLHHPLPESEEWKSEAPNMEDSKTQPSPQTPKMEASKSCPSPQNTRRGPVQARMSKRLSVFCAPGLPIFLGGFLPNSSFPPPSGSQPWRSMALVLLASYKPLESGYLTVVFPRALEVLAMAANRIGMASNHLQPYSNGLQPTSNFCPPKNSQNA